MVLDNVHGTLSMPNVGTPATPFSATGSAIPQNGHGGRMERLENTHE